MRQDKFITTSTERGYIIDIKMPIREYQKQPNAHTLSNADEVDQFLENFKILKLT